MKGSIVSYLISGILIILLQIFIFRQIQFGESFLRHTHIVFYPIIILILPLKVSRNALLFIAFIIGMIVDIFYGSLGIHTAALVFTAFIRPIVLQAFEPRGGYNVNSIPTKYHLGFNWFLQYSAVLLFVHCFVYFAIEAFTFVYWKEILLGTIFSFIFSMIFIQLYNVLINPR